ncbi:interleukin-1 receptor-associated kinase 3 [Myripristis murdjan]|uniref:interleukin-1 receptor-associated kinase 3 n=1 Tax=Myripristis murdjan TaxID=586833 RepID=UPI0011760281|nr:interleukin-1 receptor-associated kinase 3 [Myripristis murdjan]
MDSSTFLYDVPPFIIERFCKIMDIGDDRFGWRGLATRIAPSWSEVRVMERLEAVGRSPTSELLWSWAQQNKRVQDLISVLQDMGHCRALKLFLDQESSPASIDELPDCAGKNSPLNLHKESFHSNKSPSSPSSSDGNIAGLTTEGCKQHTITFQDIIKGSKNFHHDMKIAGGHFSDVYRAQTGHKTFAVKLFKQVNTASWKKLWDMFRREVEVHQLYKHPNILELLGCFSERGQYCLVYPYLPNGSLYHRLHYQDVDPPLSWSERLVIIKGTAKALHHLHAALPQPVICGNISSANIFLDEGLQPKLSDVGLACLRPQSTNQSCTITLDLNFHSNLGYLPEEYIRDGKLFFSVDVYSFGMLIMETVTGRKVIEETPKHTLLRDVLAAEVENSGSVDSCLQFVDAAGQWPAGMALTLLGLALDSTASRQRTRPNTETLLQVLSQLLPAPSCPRGDQPDILDGGALSNNQPQSLHDEGLSNNQPQSLHDDALSNVQHLSLDDRPLPDAQLRPLPSIAVENDEQHNSVCSPTATPGQTRPCECSQSEVTFLSSSADLRGEGAEVDLYSSWPVQCSCPAEADGVACEDCRANGFSSNLSDIPPTDIMVVENPAKQRLRNKLRQYNKGLLQTEELLSMTG